MGKKRFFYGNQRPSRDGETENRDKGTENARHGNEQRRGGGRKRGSTPPARLRYTEEKRAITLSALGVGEHLAELLTKNRVTTAGDLVCRTERDMFRIQGFNKKMLLELKKCLAAKGMDFLPERTDKPQNKPAAEARAVSLHGGVEGDEPRKGQSPRRRGGRRRRKTARRQTRTPARAEERGAQKTHRAPSRRGMEKGAKKRKMGFLRRF